MCKCSLITLCYNQLENATKPFIESLYKHTPINDFELIVVDNASQDGTQEYFAQLQTKYKNIKYLRNKENLGYAAGNNCGLEVVRGEYIFLLNNDLLFTYGWLSKLVEILKNKKIGLVSPMTNHCMLAQQCLPVNENLTAQNYIDKANKFYLSNKIAEILYAEKVIFFCVGMRRDVFEKVGSLDENFQKAWFEDDDYSLRVLYNGYKNAIAKNVFIFHNHSQTSAKFRLSEEGKKQFEKNKRYYEEKHSCYIKLKSASDELNKVKKSFWYFPFKIKNLIRKLRNRG